MVPADGFPRPAVTEPYRALVPLTGLGVTYMLIADAIKDLCDRRQLFEVESLDWRTARTRRVYVSPDIHRFLTHKSTDRGTNKDRRRLQALLDRFISGDFVSVALEPPEMGTDIKRLSPASAEVWEFKVGTAKHLQFRVFGRFAERNVFLALTGPTARASVDYAKEIVRCQEKWRNLFGGQPPLYGRHEDDYVWPNGVALRNS